MVSCKVRNLYDVEINFQGDMIALDSEELITILWERSRDGHNAQLLDVRDVCGSQSVSALTR